MKEYMILAYPDGDHLEKRGKLRSAEPLATTDRRITEKTELLRTARL